MIGIGIENLATDLDYIVEKAEEEPPEDKIAEFLEFIGLIEKKGDKYSLTRRGRKFLELPVE